MNNKKFYLSLISLLVMLGCSSNEHSQIMNHEPLTAFEYESILALGIPDNRPIEHSKLIGQNEIHYYNLASVKGSDLIAEIKEKGPDSSNCKKCSWSYTWGFVWKWDTIEEGGLCSVKWINSNTNFNYYLPILMKENEMSASFRERYSMWTKDVWTAINSRTVIVLQEAALVERKVMSLPKQNCEQLDNFIKTEGSLATERIYRETGAVSSDTSIEWMRDY